MEIKLESQSFGYKPISQKYEYLIIFIIYFILSVICYLRWLIDSQIIAVGEELNIQFLLKSFIGAELRQFSFPLWMPQFNLGIPLIFIPQSGILYPLNWLFTIIKTGDAFNLLIIVHVALGGFFLYIYLRNIHIKIIPAFVGGIFFAFGGFIQAYKDNIEILCTAIWLPLLLFLYQRIKNELDIKYSLLTGLVIGLQYYAGDIQVCFCSQEFLLYIAILYFVTSKNDAKKLFVLLFSPILVGIIIGSIQLYSEIIDSELYATKGTSSDFFSILLIQFRLIFPNYVSSQNYLSLSHKGFICVLALVLAIITIYKEYNKNEHVKLFFLGILLFTILSCLEILKEKIFNGIISIEPNYYLLVLNLCIASLAAIGFDKLLYSDQNKSKTYIKLVLTILAIWLVISFFSNHSTISYLNYDQNSSDNLIPKHMKIIYKTQSYIFYSQILLITLYIVWFILWRVIKKNREWLLLFLIIFIFIDSASLIRIKTGKHPYKNYPNRNEKEEITKLLKENVTEYERVLFLSDDYNNIFQMLNFSRCSGSYFLKSYSFENTMLLLTTNKKDNFSTSQEMIKNNMFSSMLGVRYIVVNKDDYNLRNILNNTYLSLNPIKHSNDSKKIISSDWIGINYITDKDYFILAAPRKGEISIISQPVELLPNTYYLISASVKAEKKPNEYLFMDIYGGPEYDSPAQELDISPRQTEKGFLTFSKVINTENLPQSGVVFRIGTFSTLPFILKDIKFEIFKNNTIILNEKLKNFDKNVYQAYPISKETKNHIIYENINHLKRAFFVSKISPIKDIYYLKDFILHPQFNPSEEAFLTQDEYNEFESKNFTKGAVFIDEYLPNKITLKTNIPDNNGFLVFSEQYVFGWKAYIDNSKTKIYQVNKLMQGVKVPKGVHQIDFIYKPKKAICQIVLGNIIFLIILFYLVFGYIKLKRTQ